MKVTEQSLCETVFELLDEAPLELLDITGQDDDVCLAAFLALYASDAESGTNESLRLLCGIPPENLLPHRQAWLGRRRAALAAA
jgi:hypothetical protein